MSVTSDTLFHFTGSLSNLINILTDKFRLSYCKENYDLAKTHSGNLYIPMVSFCDIPLAQASEHIQKYGNYGIGMTKDWGIKNGLNPVLYLETNSILAETIKTGLLAISQLAQEISEVDLSESNYKYVESLNNRVKEIRRNHSELYRYIKNYKGDLIRRTKRGTPVYRDYRFYDEREWRYVPKADMNGRKWNLDEGEYEEFRGKSKTKKLLSEPILDFTSEDIKYLIVRKEKDITPLINAIKSIRNLCDNSNMTDILITKIITVDNLKKDFL